MRNPALERCERWFQAAPSLGCFPLGSLEDRAAIDSWLAETDKQSFRFRFGSDDGSGTEWRALMKFAESLHQAFSDDERETPNGVSALWGEIWSWQPAFAPDPNDPGQVRRLLVFDHIGVLADPDWPTWGAFLASAVRFCHVLLISHEGVPPELLAGLRCAMLGEVTTTVTSPRSDRESALRAALLAPLSRIDAVALGLDFPADQIDPLMPASALERTSQDPAEVRWAERVLATACLAQARAVAAQQLDAEAVARYALHAGGAHASQTGANLDACKAFLSEGWLNAWRYDQWGAIGRTADARRVRRVAESMCRDPDGERAFVEVMHAAIVEAVTSSAASSSHYEAVALDSPVLQLLRAQGLFALGRQVPAKRDEFADLIRAELRSMERTPKVDQQVDELERWMEQWDGSAVIPTANQRPSHGQSLEEFLEGLDEITGIEVRVTLAREMKDETLRNRLLSEAVELELQNHDPNTIVFLGAAAHLLDRDQAVRLSHFALGHATLRSLLRPFGTLWHAAPFLARAAAPDTVLEMGRCIIARCRS